VWAPHRDLFKKNFNEGMADLEDVIDEEDVEELKQLIELHQNCTGSTVAADVLDRWDEMLSQFVKVMPTDYKRVLAERKRHDEEMEQKLRDDETGTFVASAR